MVSSNLQSELTAALDRLNEQQQRQVLAYAQRMGKPTPPGVPLRSLLKFAGTITSDEAAEMTKAIEEGCGQIDHENW
jgi:hypothetical protein